MKQLLTSQLPQKKKNLFLKYRKYYTAPYKLINFVSDCLFLLGLTFWSIGIAVSTYYGYHSHLHYNHYFTSMPTSVVVGLVPAFVGPILFTIGGSTQRLKVGSKSLKVAACWNKIISVLLLINVALFLGFGINSYQNTGTWWEIVLALLCLWFSGHILFINFYWLYRENKESGFVRSQITPVNKN